MHHQLGRTKSGQTMKVCPTDGGRGGAQRSPTVSGVAWRVTSERHTNSNDALDRLKGVVKPFTSGYTGIYTYT